MRQRSISLMALFLCLALFHSGCSSQRTNIKGSDQPGERQDNLKFDLGNFTNVTGTDYVRASIYLDKEHSYAFSSSGSDSEIRNFLFLNVKTRESRLLLPVRDYEILSSWELRPGTETTSAINSKYGSAETRDNQPEVPTQWLLYLVLKTDTNQNDKFDFGDLKTAAISDYSGSGYAEVLSGILKLHYSIVVDANTLVVVYEKDGKDFSSVIDLPARKITDTKDLINWRNGQ